MTDFKVTGEASIDPDHIISDVDEIIAKLDEFKDKVDEIDAKLDELSHKRVSIEVVIDGQDKLDELKLFLDELDDREYLARVRVDIQDKDKLDDLKMKIDEMTIRDHEVKVDVNVDGIAKASAEIDYLNRKLDENARAAKKASDSTKEFRFSWLLLAPLLAPLAGILAITAGGALGLASALLTMVVPLATVAIATKSAYGELTTFAGTLSTQVTSAISAAGSSFSSIYNILEKNSAAFQKMDHYTQDAVVEYFLLKNAISGFQSAVKPEVMSVLIMGMQLLQEVLTYLTPLAQNAGDALSYMIGQLYRRLQDPTFQKFFTDMDNNIATLVIDWGGGVLNIVEGLAAILDAFLPLGLQMSNGFLNMTKSFDTWAQHLADSKGFKKFVEEVQKDGPILLNILGQVIKLFGLLFTALNNTSQTDGFLKFLDKLLKDINQFLTAHPALAQIAVDIGLIAISASKLAPLLAPLVSFLLTPMGLAVAGILGLAVGFYLAYTNSKTFHDWVDKNLLPGLKKLGDTANQVKNWFISLWPDVQRVWQLYGANILAIVETLWNTIVGIIQGVVTIIEGIINVFLGVITGNWSQVWHGIGQIFSGAWQTITTLMGGFSNVLTNLVEILGKMLWTLFKSAFNSILGSFVQWGVSVVASVAQTFSNIISNVVTWGTNFLTGITNAVVNVETFFLNLPGKIISWLGDLGSLLINAGENLISGLISGIENSLPSLQGLLGDVTSWITSWKGPPSKDKVLLYDAGQMIMEGLVNGLESKYSKVQNSLQGFTKTIGNTFGEQFTKDIDTRITTSLNNTQSASNVPIGSGSSAAGANNGGNTHVSFAAGSIVVNNPKAEQPGITLTRTLQGVARWGIVQAPVGFTTQG